MFTWCPSSNGVESRAGGKRCEFDLMAKKSTSETAVTAEFERAIDEMAKEVVSRMSPLEIGLLRYPYSEPVKLKHVPADVVDDHLTRYTKAELKRGQFFRIGDQYTFFMDQKAKAKREAKGDFASSK